MWNNSIELLEYVTTELEEAIKDSRESLIIPLEKNFENNTFEIRKAADSLNIKECTLILRKTYYEFNIQSTVFVKSRYNELRNPLIWELTLKQ